MADHARFEYVPPKSWDQFEEMCADLFQTMWNDASLVRHGRSGQSQDGVDVVARHGALYPVGIQCKRRAKWPVSKVTIAQIDSEIKDAEAFKPALKHFYIVTTAQDDTKLQEHLRTMNEARRSAKKFEVTLLGWSELVRRVTLEPTVAHKHFGAVVQWAARSPSLCWRHGSPGGVCCGSRIANLSLPWKNWPWTSTTIPMAVS
jgi:hypothetical protein